MSRYIRVLNLFPSRVVVVAVCCPECCFYVYEGNICHIELAQRRVDLLPTGSFSAAQASLSYHIQMLQLLPKLNSQRPTISMGNLENHQIRSERNELHRK